jgi:hypothetical protein
MRKRSMPRATALALSLVLTGLSPCFLRAEDTLEKVGVAVGVTGGNMVFIPAKAASVSMGALAGALSFLLTGNADLTKQIWEDTFQGPYLITPEVAKTAVGERPELVRSP